MSVRRLMARADAIASALNDGAEHAESLADWRALLRLSGERDECIAAVLRERGQVDWVIAREWVPGLAATATTLSLLDICAEARRREVA